MCPFNVPLRVNNESSRSVVEALLDNVLPLGRVEIVRGQGLREILQTIVIHVVKDAKPLEYFHTLFHHHALPSVTKLLYHDSESRPRQRFPNPGSHMSKCESGFENDFVRKMWPRKSKVSHFLEAARGQQFAALGRHNVKIWLSPFFTEITGPE